MKVTKAWLQEKSACVDGVEWFSKQKETDGISLVKNLLDVQISWANWLVTRIMDKSQKVQYAIFAAEQVIHLFEKKYPEDELPRNAIEAAKKWLADPSEKNRVVAYTATAAADAAYAAAAADATAAAYAATAAYDAATVAYAAYDAADAAYDAYDAADAAYDAADAAAAAYAAATAATAADADAAANKMKKKIIEYGIEILEKSLMAQAK